MVVFENVSVLPMTGGGAAGGGVDDDRVLRGRTVVVRDGVIEVIGATGRVAVPAEAVRVDGTGRTLMPGLADMHVHLMAEGMLELFVLTGVTTVRNLAGEPIHLEWREEARRGERLSPAIFTTGPTVDGSPPAANPELGPVIVETAEAARRAVAEQKAAGYDFIKAYSALEPESYRALMEAAREHDIRVVGHLPREVGLGPVLELGQASIEHAEEFIYTHLRRDLDPARIKEIVDMVAASGTYVVPTLSTYANFTRQIGRPDSLETLLARPEMAYLHPGFVQYWRHQNDFPLRSDSTEHRERLAYQRELVRALDRAGVPILAGTDTPIPVMIPGFSMREELAELERAGLPRYSVLWAATAGPGQFIAETVAEPGTRFGVVAVGAKADLLLLDGNPLEDLGAIERLAGVMVAGRWLGRSEIEARLEAMAGR